MDTLTPNPHAAQARKVELAKRALDDWKKNSKVTGKGWALLLLEDQDDAVTDSVDVIRDVRVVPVLHMRGPQTPRGSPLDDQALFVQAIVALGRAGVSFAGLGYSLSAFAYDNESVPRGIAASIERRERTPLTMVLARRPRPHFSSPDHAAQAHMGDHATLRDWQREYADPPIEVSSALPPLEVKTVRGPYKEIASSALALHRKATATTRVDPHDLTNWCPVLFTDKDIRVTSEQGLAVALLETCADNCLDDPDSDASLRRLARELRNRVLAVQEDVTRGRFLPAQAYLRGIYRRDPDFDPLRRSLTGFIEEARSIPGHDNIWKSHWNVSKSTIV